MAQRSRSQRSSSETRRRRPAKTAASQRTAQAVDVAHPERLVVEEPPPEPHYPRYRVEPGTPVRLAEVDPDESERYQRKKDVSDELKRQRDRIRDLQARLYGGQKRSLLIVLQA